MQLIVLSVGVFSVRQVLAQTDTERDDAIFGDTTSPSDSARDDSVFDSPDNVPESSADAAVFGSSTDAAPIPSTRLEDRLSAALETRDNILQIGGQAYLRIDALAKDSSAAGDLPLSTPMLCDVYLDARPNDRLRLYVRGRLDHRPSIADGAGVSATGSGGARLDIESRPRTRALVDQFWLKFDIDRTIFVTVGRQPIRWGSGRFWNPTDVVLMERRDPLAVFDERRGVELVKLHYPLESLGWNFYAVATYAGAGKPEDVGGALRGEFLFSTVEISLSLARMPGRVTSVGDLPRFFGDPDARTFTRQNPWLLGADISAGVGLFDLRVEMGVQKGIEQAFFRHNRGGLLDSFTRENKWLLQSTVGAEMAIRYSDEDNVVLGIEYFYNQRGANAPEPALLLVGLASPLYIGRHYAAAYAIFVQPGSWNDTTVSASMLANLSDNSALARLDWSLRILTHLDFNVYGAYHFGEPGEFRIAFSLPDGLAAAPGPVTAPPELPGGTQVLDIGAGLRLFF